MAGKKLAAALNRAPSAKTRTPQDVWRDAQMRARGETPAGMRPIQQAPQQIGGIGGPSSNRFMQQPQMIDPGFSKPYPQALNGFGQGGFRPIPNPDPNDPNKLGVDANGNQITTLIGRIPPHQQGQLNQWMNSMAGQNPDPFRQQPMPQGMQPQQIQQLPQRSMTRSPGVGLDGQRLNSYWSK